MKSNAWLFVFAVQWTDILLSEKVEDLRRGAGAVKESALANMVQSDLQTEKTVQQHHRRHEYNALVYVIYWRKTRK